MGHLWRICCLWNRGPRHAVRNCQGGKPTTQHEIRFLNVFEILLGLAMHRLAVLHCPWGECRPLGGTVPWGWPMENRSTCIPRILRQTIYVQEFDWAWLCRARAQKYSNQPWSAVNSENDTVAEETCSPPESGWALAMRHPSWLLFVTCDFARRLRVTKPLMQPRRFAKQRPACRFVMLVIRSTYPLNVRGISALTCGVQTIEWLPHTDIPSSEAKAFNALIPSLPPGAISCGAKHRMTATHWHPQLRS